MQNEQKQFDMNYHRSNFFVHCWKNWRYQKDISKLAHLYRLTVTYFWRWCEVKLIIEKKLDLINIVSPAGNSKAWWTFNARVAKSVCVRRTREFDMVWCFSCKIVDVLASVNMWQFNFSPGVWELDNCKLL